MQGTRWTVGHWTTTRQSVIYIEREGGRGDRKKKCDFQTTSFVYIFFSLNALWRGRCTMYIDIYLVIIAFSLQLLCIATELQHVGRHPTASDSAQWTGRSGFFLTLFRRSYGIHWITDACENTWISSPSHCARPFLLYAFTFTVYYFYLDSTEIYA